MPGKRGDGIIRAKSILKDLQDPKGCHTREELLSKYDISMDSLNKDIRALRDSGIKIRYKQCFFVSVVKAESIDY